MSVCKCGLAKTYHGPNPPNLADHEYDPPTPEAIHPLSAEDAVSVLNGVPHDHEGPPCTACLRDGYHKGVAAQPPDPDALREAIDAIDKAWDLVADLCTGKRRWTMTVPPEPDRDSDLVIGDALTKSRTILAALAAGGES